LYDYFVSLHNDVLNVTNYKAENVLCEHNLNDDCCRFNELDKPITLEEIEYLIKKVNKAWCDTCILSSHILDLFNYIFILAISP